MRISASNRWRILIAVVTLILLYYVYRSYHDYSNLDIDEPHPQQDQLAYSKKGSPVLISVFYEALCPDSKGFVLRQLIPTYRKIPNLVEIEFFPYGKADTHISPDGSLSFDCQHGERECEANIIHCCAIEAIHDTETRLNMVACMIRDNNNPQESFLRCSKEFDIDSETIQKCFSSLHGKELLKIAGEATKALRPPVSFIPTITLDGDQRSQKLLLKDLLSEICDVLKIGGMVPKACKDT